MGERTRPTVVGHENPYRAGSSFSEVWNEGYDAALAAMTDEPGLRAAMAEHLREATTTARPQKRESVLSPSPPALSMRSASPGRRNATEQDEP